MKKEYFQLALKTLRRRRLRSWLTMIGIFIGIAAVVSLISLGTGMQNAIETQFFHLGADKLTIEVKGPVNGPPGLNSDIELTDGDLRVVRHSNGIEVATGRILESITVKFNEKERHPYLASLPQDLKERAMVSDVANVGDDKILYGRSLKPEDQFKVMMSEDYYNDKNFNGKALRVGDKILINNQSVDVVGFYKKTGNPLVDHSFVMNEDAMRRLLNIPDRVNMIIAKVLPGADIDIVADNVEKDLRNYRNVKVGKEDFEVQTGAQILDTFKTILSIVTAVLVGIAAISLLVGSIGIMNTMYTSVLERRREIGVMKAIGAKNRNVLTIFLIESGVLGLLGGAIGIFLGIFFSKTVEIISTRALGTTLIQSYFPWYLILGALLFSFLIGSIAGTFPALQAAKLPVVEALRE